MLFHSHIETNNSPILWVGSWDIQIWLWLLTHPEHAAQCTQVLPLSSRLLISDSEIWKTNLLIHNYVGTKSSSFSGLGLICFDGNMFWNSKISFVYVCLFVFSFKMQTMYLYLRANKQHFNYFNLPSLYLLYLKTYMSRSWAALFGMIFSFQSVNACIFCCFYYFFYVIR